MGQRGVNKAIIWGHVGKAPDLKYMVNGNAVVNLSVATSETCKDQRGIMQMLGDVSQKTSIANNNKIQVNNYVGSEIIFTNTVAYRLWRNTQHNRRSMLPR